MLILGLTGSIGMGKTTTAAMFHDEGIHVHDSDAAVHELYRGEAVAAIEAAFPGTVREGAVDRALLAPLVLSDPAALARLEAIVHPIVAKSRNAFLAEAQKSGSHIVVLDIPLLFETGLDRQVDAVVLVTAPETVQRERLRQRPGMTSEHLEVIVQRQISDIEKRARAHFIIDSAHGFDSARRQVRGVLRALAGVKNNR
ncbi:MAG TPA: dephospho-CoA kinase [Methylocella sp.]|nr:dephospho-CoA kinase [Methylocella sp.]